MNKSSRRSFIANTGKAAMAGAVMTNSNNMQQKEMKNIFIHHVYFWLKNAGNQADLGKLVAGLKKLSAIKTLQKYHIGVPATSKRDVVDSSYSVSWFVLFKNQADEDSYQEDPIHLKFVEDCSSLWSKVIVYDSEDVKL